MSRFRLRIAGAVATAVLTIGVAVAVAADPPPTGPVYPPPGGVTLTSEGDNGRVGGGTWTYTDLHVADFDPLWWSVWSDALPKLAIDGAIDEPGETMTFSPSASDLAAGVLAFTGTVDHPVLGVHASRVRIATTTTAGAPVAMDAAGDAGLPADIGGAAVIPGDFKANVLFTVDGVPAKDWFDAARTSPGVDDGGLRTSISAGFYYVPANDPPVASFTWEPETPTAGRTVEFTSTSTDSDGTIENTEWDLDGDGQYDDATGETASTAFGAAGDHTVGVRVTDDRDGVDTHTATVTVVANEPPAASFAWSPQNPRALQAVSFSSTSTDSDGVITATAWDLDGDGEYDDASGATASRSFDEAGSYTVGVRVVDDLGGTDTHTETIVVRTCEPGPVSQALRTVGGLAGIEPVVRQLNCELLEPLGL